MFVERQDAAGNGVAGGVIAANNQQQDIAQQFLRGHVIGGRVVGKHGNQVKLGGLGFALVVILSEVGETLEQFLETLFRGIKIFRVAQVGNRVRPIDQLHAVFLGHVKQGRQHLPGELH